MSRFFNERTSAGLSYTLYLFLLVSTQLFENVALWHSAPDREAAISKSPNLIKDSAFYQHSHS
jgi:hypothetical protein